MQTQFRHIDAGAPLTVSRGKFRRVTAIDEYPDPSYLDDEAGQERLSAYRNGSWHLIGIQAAATFLIPHGGHFVTQTVTSPGLWGIESDSDESYLDDVYAEECESLADMLAALGVTVTD